MNRMVKLCGRGLRYVRQYGSAKLYYKIKERAERNRAESGYEAWLLEQLREDDGAVKKAAALAEKGPLISILVPAYETPPLFLRQMIDSVLEQSGVCISGDSQISGKPLIVNPGILPLIFLCYLLYLVGRASIRNAKLQISIALHCGWKPFRQGREASRAI